MTSWVLTVFLMAATADRTSHAEHRHSHLWLMNRIETLVRLPVGAHQLKEYQRVYAPLDQRSVGWASATKPKLDSPKIIGVYTSLGPGKGQRWSDNLPIVFDGDCALITVIYDVQQDRIESATCNGPG